MLSESGPQITVNFGKKNTEPPSFLQRLILKVHDSACQRDRSQRLSEIMSLGNGEVQKWLLEDSKPL
jgi:hypothetical protein